MSNKPKKFVDMLAHKFNKLTGDTTIKCLNFILNLIKRATSLNKNFMIYTPIFITTKIDKKLISNNFKNKLFDCI